MWDSGTRVRDFLADGFQNPRTRLSDRAPGRTAQLDQRLLRQASMRLFGSERQSLIEVVRKVANLQGGYGRAPGNNLFAL